MDSNDDFWRPEDYASARRLVEASVKFQQRKLGNRRFRVFQWFCWLLGLNLIEVICVHDLHPTRCGRLLAVVRMLAGRFWAWLRLW
jgi:hypothetical protein